MAKEALVVPEEALLEVIDVIRIGLKFVKVTEDTYRELTRWCDEEEAYVKGLPNGD